MLKGVQNLDQEAKVRLIAIGASTGGIQAIEKILFALPKEFPCIVIVQHILHGFTDLLAEQLQQKSRLIVQVAHGGESVERNKVFIADHGTQLRVKLEQGRIMLERGETEKCSGHSPSINVLFSSCTVLGKEAIGVILTGMGEDGADGLLAMRQAGAYTIGQEEKSCIVYGMPKAAYLKGAVACQLPLDKIANELIFRTKERGLYGK